MLALKRPVETHWRTEKTPREWLIHFRGVWQDRGYTIGYAKSQQQNGMMADASPSKTFEPNASGGGTRMALPHYRGDNGRDRL